MRDSVLEIWLRLLALHVPEQNNENSRKEIMFSIRNEWLLMSRGYFGGMIHVGLDEFANTIDGKEIIIEAIASLEAALKKAPKYLSKDVINLLGIEGTYLDDFETDSLLEVCSAFDALIQGRINTDASSTSVMPGSKKLP